jgi:hypothetical protein
VRGVFGVPVFAPNADVSLIAAKRRDEPLVNIGGLPGERELETAIPSSSESERSAGTSVERQSSTSSRAFRKRCRTADLAPDDPDWRPASFVPYFIDEDAVQAQSRITQLGGRSCI